MRVTFDALTGVEDEPLALEQMIHVAEADEDVVADPGPAQGFYQAHDYGRGGEEKEWRREARAWHGARSYHAFHYVTNPTPTLTRTLGGASASSSFFGYTPLYGTD